MKQTRIYLVRHGATQLTAENRFSGAVGVDLSDDGRWQCERLGERLQRHGVDAIYASPLSRTVETATIIGWGRTCEAACGGSVHEQAAEKLNDAKLKAFGRLAAHA